jgi:hypothetical protein
MRSMQQHVTTNKQQRILAAAAAVQHKDATDRWLAS